MRPITKNIFVVDEAGNEYEATYKKRAEGLVKNGRARFIADNKICLACSPNDILEDNRMNDENKLSGESSPEIPEFSMGYILSRMDKIINDTEYIRTTLEALKDFEISGNANDNASQAKAEAIGEVVKCRETTNQQILSMLEKMYEDLKPKQQTLQDKAMDFVERTLNNGSLSFEEKEQISDLLDAIRHINN